MQPGLWQILIIAVVVLLLFGGRGMISNLMGDAAKGIRSFRDGLKSDDGKGDETPAAPLPRPEAEKEDAKR